MERKIAISVIVPVYKGFRFLREATDSLRRQSFADWECLLVDDGSKDGSGRLADEIAAEDTRFRVIHRPNGGTSVARNTAMSLARGRYLAFLDEDDVYHPRLLEVLFDAAVRTDADVISCGFLKFAEDEHPDFSDMCPEPGDWRVAEGAGVADLAAQGYRGIPYEIWTRLFRRELVADHPFPQGVRVEQDYLWIYTLLPRIRRYAHCDWKGYAWRASSTGGFLHPDFASMMSLLKTTETVYRAMADGMRMNEEQLRDFRRATELDLEENVVMRLRKGFRLSRDESCEFRRGLRGLESMGIDVRHVLRRKKRLLWTMFLLTGSTGWVRK